jgi:hypothetical protein
MPTGKGKSMIPTILCVLFVVAAITSGAVLSNAYRQAFRYHGELRNALAACEDHREVRIRHVELRVHAAVVQLPFARIATPRKDGGLVPTLPLAA